VTLADEVRAHAARVMEQPRWVRIDAERLDALADAWAGSVPEPELDPRTHFVEGDEDAVAAFLLTLDAINFGSGWFPTLRKRPGMSGYFTVAAGLTDRFRAHGPYSNAELRAMRTDEIAGVLGQPRDHELMSLFAQALRQLGTFLGERTPLQLAREARGSALRLAETVARGMSMWNDIGFYKRAQILGSDLALGGIGGFTDVDALTIFADNLVPHVLRVDGVLTYAPALAEHVDARRLLTDTTQECEIRAAAVHACTRLAERLGLPERVVDMWLWNRGQAPEFKAVPRHRARSVFY
jgi:hypothetical protein